MKHIIIHYDEIALKKGNRDYFERLLLSNMQETFGKKTDKIKKEYGYYIATFKKDVTPKDIEIIKKVPGITNFSIGKETDLDLKDINKTALTLITGKEKTFGINTKRRNKNFELTSHDVNKEVGAFIVKETGLKVNLSNPDTKITIELCNKQAYLSKEKIKGVGGLPTGSSAKTLCLLSGGIDSPVAGSMFSKRGSKVSYVHFQNRLLNTGAVQSKIEDLTKVLSTFQNGAKLYIVPFDKIQRKIIKNVPSKLRMLIYKRLMLKLASRIANKEKAKALIVGDSIAQVASQTLENMESIYFDIDKLVLKPLIGMNKQEIIDIAKEVGTYEVSIQPYDDCCSYYVAEHPETKASIEMIQKAEENLDITEEFEDALKNLKISRF